MHLLLLPQGDNKNKNHIIGKLNELKGFLLRKKKQ